MYQFVLLSANQLGQSAGATQIESPAHRRLVQPGILGLSSLRKSLRLYARKAHLKSELGQLQSQQVLHSLRARVVLAIDHMQYTLGGDL